jgi:hypothetical protein
MAAVPTFRVKNPTLSQTARQGGQPRVHFGLRRSDAPDQVFLFLLAFCADGEGVEHAQR